MFIEATKENKGSVYVGGGKGIFSFKPEEIGKFCRHCSQSFQAQSLGNIYDQI